MEEQAGRQWAASQELIREQLTQSIERGQEAETLLGNKALVEWWEGFQASLIDTADQVPLNDTVARDRIYMTLGILRKLKSDLKRYVEEGVTAKQDLSNFLDLEKKGLIGRLFDV